MKREFANGSVKLEDLINMDKPLHVLREVERIVAMIFPNFDPTPIRVVFDHILALFRGEYPGYRRCNIFYHDLKHTTDCFVAMTRLMHGACLEGVRLSEHQVWLGLISSLMHDTGYLQSVDDDSGTGAKYTLTHVQRSIDFMERYFKENGLIRGDFLLCRSCLECTDFDTDLTEIDFESYEHEMLAKMLGTADLLGQMADRTYLARLPFLYLEFTEGGVPGFRNELDLLSKTPDFWEYAKLRFTRDLSNVDRFMRYHFALRWELDRDLYREAIEMNISYVKHLVEKHPNNYRKHLRRGGLMKILGKMSFDGGSVRKND
jgi:hypothetical protein